MRMEQCSKSNRCSKSHNYSAWLCMLGLGLGFKKVQQEPQLQCMVAQVNALSAHLERSRDSLACRVCLSRDALISAGKIT